MTDSELKQIKEQFVRLCENEMAQVPPDPADVSDLMEWSKSIPDTSGPRPLTKNCV